MINRNSYILGGVIVASGFLFWYFVQDPVKEFALSTGASLYSLAALSGYLISVSLGLLLMERVGTFLTAVVLSILPSVFFFGATLTQAAVVIVAIVILARSFLAAANERTNRISFSAAQVLTRSLPMLFTAVSLLVASGYYLTLTGGSYRLTGEKLLPRAFFDSSLRFLQPLVLNRFFPGFNEHMRVDDYVLGIAAPRISTPAAALAPSEREQRLEQARQGFFRDFNISITGNESLGDVFYRAAVKKSDELISAYEKFIPAAFALGLFLVFKTAGFPLVWLVIFLTWIILKVLVASHIVERRVVDTKREEVRWRYITKP